LPLSMTLCGKPSLCCCQFLRSELWATSVLMKGWWQSAP
jgi:hypothetical protein